jgi:hypothetical protein
MQGTGLQVSIYDRHLYIAMWSSVGEIWRMENGE